MAATIDHRPTDRHVLGVAVARVLALALRPCSHPCVDKKSFPSTKKSRFVDVDEAMCYAPTKCRAARQPRISVASTVRRPHVNRERESLHVNCSSNVD